jgi:hypothetical protein
VEARRSSWTPLNLLAETARATRDLRMASVTDRMLLLDRTGDTAVDGLVALHDPATVHPAHAWRAKWTSPRMLEDERTLLAAAAAPTRALANPTMVRAYLGVAVTPPDHRPPMPAMDLPHLTTEQARAVDQVLGQSRVVQVLVGPAGSGKTTTLRVLSTIWQRTTDPGHVQALAPSATAAATLQAALGVPCETTAKWLHESTGPGAQQRARMLEVARAAGTTAGTTLAVELALTQQRWTLPRGGLLIVDEASLTDTRTLAELARQADAAGARVLLVGDPAQHDPVGAGGAFGLLARHTRHAQLAGLHRYTHPWEAQATLQLRNGNPAALHEYAAHHRCTPPPPAHPPTPSATSSSTPLSPRGRPTKPPASTRCCWPPTPPPPPSSTPAPAPSAWRPARSPPTACHSATAPPRHRRPHPHPPQHPRTHRHRPALDPQRRPLHVTAIHPDGSLSAHRRATQPRTAGSRPRFASPPPTWPSTSTSATP